MDGEVSLKEGEYHLGADIALRYIQSIDPRDMVMHREALASTALSGNKLAQICCSTLDRLDKKEPVSDRYLMGLAWVLWSLNTPGSLQNDIV